MIIEKLDSPREVGSPVCTKKRIFCTHIKTSVQKNGFFVHTREAVHNFCLPLHTTISKQSKVPL